MIIIKSQAEIQIMKEAGRVTAEILASLRNIIEPGMKTKDIDAYIEGEILRNKMILRDASISAVTLPASFMI